ncbi:radical SAM protein [Kitasatospora azatica]|uniref:radical SAM protein n=1 Tax=Kitasatospora azatica TaxID=58347 RepID=UPI002D2195F1|nr:radical SAM protein [Kitasatospora azatica]
MEILRFRPIPAAAVYFGLTRRCPLHCRHCSTESLMDSEQYPARMFLRFAETFTEQNRPELTLMSGGEVMLRPGLVRDIAERARAVGSRSYALSGLFFAQKPRIPKAVRAAIDSLDHFAASTDRFHEEEVPRADVFRVLHELLDAGKDVSLQITGEGPDDPYLADITAAVRREFDDRVPMLVVPLAPVGRAREWMGQQPQAAYPATAAPCSLACWPVIGFNGQVTSCGNQDVMDGKVPLPAHLFLGHIAHDDWETVKRKALESPMVGAIRTYGPEYLMERYAGEGNCEGYCQTCWKMSTTPGVKEGVRALALLPSTIATRETVERISVAAGPLGFARRFGVNGYAELVTLGGAVERDLACAG